MHRVSIYNVAIHKRGKPKDLMLLGNFDGSGHYLGDFLLKLFDPKSFAANNGDDTKDVFSSMRKLAGANNDEVQAIFHPGERGVPADIMNPDGQLGFRQTPDHTQVLRSGSLFRLPRKSKLGLWACHVNNNRGIKSLVAPAIETAFNKEHPDYILRLSPSIDSAALIAAVEEDRLLTAHLYKFEKSSDVKDGEKWSVSDTHLKIETIIKPERGRRLISALSKKFFGGDDGAFGRIVEFQGLSYDAAKLEVELAGGLKRTFNIERPEAGHPFSQDISPADGPDGDPTDASLFAELGKVLTEME